MHTDRRCRSGLVVFLMAVPICDACVGSTGSDLVEFQAFAAGPADAHQGQPLDFVTGRGFHVVLTRAKVHVGAVYLNQSVPTSGAQATSCVLPGIYVAEVTSGLDIDALSPSLQPFSTTGHGTAVRALAGEVWLMGTKDVNAQDDTTVLFDLAGAADGGGKQYPFEARFTIGKNRIVPPKDPSTPGTSPLCKQRVVSPIPINMTPRSGGALVVRIDPRGWFTNVDFSQLAPASGDPPIHQFVDGPADPASNNLYLGMHASQGVYSFDWSTDSP